MNNTSTNYAALPVIFSRVDPASRRPNIIAKYSPRGLQMAPLMPALSCICFTRSSLFLRYKLYFARRRVTVALLVCVKTQDRRVFVFLSRAQPPLVAVRPLVVVAAFPVHAK